MKRMIIHVFLRNDESYNTTSEADRDIGSEREGDCAVYTLLNEQG